MEQLTIIPMGENITQKDLHFLQEPLQQIFHTQALLADPIPLPLNAYNAQRNQYLSNRILDSLNARAAAAANNRILAVTNHDLTVPDLNFVFGQADMNSGAAIISLARLRPEFYSDPPDTSLFEKRALTEAVHEIGHTLWLDHCPNPKCVMYFSNTLKDTDAKGCSFCERCRRILAATALK